mmetsp:Transcript_49459/g.160847  ORF Transcript_49459/g.160847 Transcript_49459/m.160847 type:complete len:144 (-) Transcript_49459:290-721(-)
MSAAGADTVLAQQRRGAVKDEEARPSRAAHRAPLHRRASSSSSSSSATTATTAISAAVSAAVSSTAPPPPPALSPESSHARSVAEAALPERRRALPAHALQAVAAGGQQLRHGALDVRELCGARRPDTRQQQRPRADISTGEA